VALNCGGLSRELLASELFGYADGAFTGARRGGAVGKVEAARGGTLFLDEIGEMPLDLQPMFLRVLEEREVCRLGETLPRKVEFRLVAATHRDLRREVERGAFRADLFYRLSVVAITIPPLRDRPDEIPALAAHFAAEVAARYGLPERRFDAAALARLAAHDWPGNVRELLCVIERIVVFADDDVIRAEHVSHELDRMRAPTLGGAPATSEPAPTSAPPRTSDAPATSSLQSRRDEAEREAVLDALRRAGQNRTQAARLLGVSRRTLYNRLESLGIVDA
jgi:transcriptional regulator with PAS, ATPase and Fis domain